MEATTIPNVLLPWPSCELISKKQISFVHYHYHHHHHDCYQQHRLQCDQKVTNDDEGEGGVTIPSKNDDVIYEQPLTFFFFLKQNFNEQHGIAICLKVLGALLSTHSGDSKNSSSFQQVGHRQRAKSCLNLAMTVLKSYFHFFWLFSAAQNMLFYILHSPFYIKHYTFML